MERVLSKLGIDLPCQTARAASLKESREWTLNEECESVPSLTKDDDTVTTIDSDDESSLCASPGVKFATPLVTEVRYRPATPPEDRAELFYTSKEISRFRRKYRSTRQKHVQFVEDVVTDVCYTANYSNPRDLYYSEEELQSFLNEFVAEIES
mmetsp:Transcript_2628/g.3821  ORF Transcript_2628/g.3821 Transcript_2628/m.3821 type:complete len:153 (+) Transcript_2628:66-524(+)|eukprot:CAMPEP_0118679042 /NCGR_PEP_ID=MMETSP0800-20121206/3560_1 /TAXON_ID=210618 ORGANISM="Striatella unipunctata, Strain CCMP2910" /NCGR_SAMPLE_ID=MMETSP0800 /ASSEMBLY_ACC=CAM_ASM_000638 /LENGTH=152 /DNA_ID=CAMNT_0006574977 /DNA_START=99 /DNA_END=557 /DNA_ORIENTATION=+